MPNRVNYIWYMQLKNYVININDDLHPRLRLAVRVLPAILLQAPHHADAAALLQHLPAVLGQSGPGLHVEVGDFLLRLIVLLVEPVRGHGERADLVAVRRGLEDRIPDEVAFDNDGIEVVQHGSLHRPPLRAALAT